MLHNARVRNLSTSTLKSFPELVPLVPVHNWLSSQLSPTILSGKETSQLLLREHILQVHGSPKALVVCEIGLPSLQVLSYGLFLVG